MVKGGVYIVKNKWTMHINFTQYFRSTEEMKRKQSFCPELWGNNRSTGLWWSNQWNCNVAHPRITWTILPSLWAIIDFLIFKLLLFLVYSSLSRGCYTKLTIINVTFHFSTSVKIQIFGCSYFSPISILSLTLK